MIAKQNLDGYMAKLEQELAARKESTSSATSPADTFDGSNGDTDGSPGAAAALSRDSKPGDDWAQETLSRVEACFQKRFQLAGCSLVEGLTVNSATCQADWDDMTLSSLLYRS